MINFVFINEKVEIFSINHSSRHQNIGDNQFEPISIEKA